MANILGISASLRNARFGKGSEDLCNDLRTLTDREALEGYLKAQSKIRFEDFYEAGRDKNLSFDHIYENLQKSRGDQGLSNSEAALAAGLWGALQKGAEISHLGLSSYFRANGSVRNMDELREHILKADGILLSGPVYFGDRGSLAQNFIEFIREDDACREHLEGKVYGGIAVGAKRNGGQETTLIYQMVDMTNLNMLAVGNDSATTSQYGGTAVAGDVGTLPSDEYGINTCIGTGRRIAHVCNLIESSKESDLRDKVNIAIWLLQDTEDHHGKQLMRELCDDIEKQAPFINFEILDFTDEQIYRCIACDICPISVGESDEYRCIISSKSDLFVNEHTNILEPDGVLLAAYSPKDRQDIKSVYQKFIERTRYIRRDDYRFTDLLGAPFVISEVGSNQNLHIRMITSYIRHHTIMHHPFIGIEHEGKLLDRESLVQKGVEFAHNAKKLTIGRLKAPSVAAQEVAYNPIGYQISLEKSELDRKAANADELHDAIDQAHINKRSRLVG